MKTFQQQKPKVNILVMPVENQWQAKVFRADNAAMTYETVKYFDPQSACSDAQNWVSKNYFLVGRVSGMNDTPRHQKAQHARRSYSKRWSAT